VGFTQEALEFMATALAHHFQFDQGLFDRFRGHDVPRLSQWIGNLRLRPDRLKCCYLSGKMVADDRF
jgi:hypothetical protein